MAITKIQSESLNLADTYAFTGTVTGAGEANTPLVALKGNGSDQTVTANAFTTVTFWSVETDTESMYASNKITIPSGKGGKYFIAATVQLNSATDINTVALRIRTNDNATNFLYVQHRHTNFDSLTVSGARNLSAGDNLTLDIYHSDGSDKTIEANDYQANWVVYRITE